MMQQKDFDKLPQLDRIEFRQRLEIIKETYESRGHKIGYSGHEEGISACIVAKTLGAEIFERHITLSRSNWGTDQAASIVYDQLWRLIRDLKKVNVWRGDGIKKIYESELPIKAKLRGEIK
jgi:N-acetylneuraminate synthase